MSRPAKPTRLLLSVLAVAASLLATLVISGLANRGAFEDWYLVHVSGPRLEREFGFSSGILERSAMDGWNGQLILTRVDPQGILGRAGIRSRDLPIGFEHGSETGFLWELRAASEGREVSFHVLAEAELSTGYSAWRTITLPARARR